MLWKWAEHSADSTAGGTLWRREGGGGLLFKDESAKFD